MEKVVTEEEDKEVEEDKIRQALRSLYSQNIQRGPPLGECQKVQRFAFFVTRQSEHANELFKYANEVFNMHLYNRAQG